MLLHDLWKMNWIGYEIMYIFPHKPHKPNHCKIIFLSISIQVYFIYSARRIGDCIHLPKFWTDGCLCHKIIRGWEPYDVSWTSYHIHQNWEWAWLQSGASSSRKLASWKKHKRRNVSGVEGRTGAGKSSLVAALQRMPEAQGVLMIDDVPIKGISLQKTQRCISVLDKNPVLFSGSLKKILFLWNNFVIKIMASPWRCSIERVGGKAGRGAGSWIVGTRSKLQCRRATVDLSGSCSVAPKRDNNLGWTHCTCRSKSRTNNMEGSEREIEGFHCYHYSSPFEHHYRLWSDFDHEKWRDRWDRQFWTTNKWYVVILNFQFKKWVHHYIFFNRILVSRFSLFQSIFANFFIRLFK